MYVKLLIFLLTYSSLALAEEANTNKKKKRYFTNESEISILNASGNSNFKTYNSKTTNNYKFKNQNFVFGGHYTYGESNTALNARNWDANFNHFYAFNKKFSLVTAEIIEGNTFQQIRSRYNTDFGGKYSLIKKKKLKFFFLLSYRYMTENRYEDINTIVQHKGRIYSEWEYQKNKNIEFKVWGDFIPNFTNGHDWLFTSEASLTSIISTVFSIKVAYKYMYDNLPAQPELAKYDSLATTSLVAKFD